MRIEKTMFEKRHVQLDRQKKIRQKIIDMKTIRQEFIRHKIFNKKIIRHIIFFKNCSKNNDYLKKFRH